MPDPDDELTQSVLRMTYDAMVDDALSVRGPSHVPLRPQRFHSSAAVEKLRSRIVSACHAANAEEGMVEYFSTRWLDRFKPVLM